MRISAGTTWHSKTAFRIHLFYSPIFRQPHRYGSSRILGRSEGTPHVKTNSSSAYHRSEFSNAPISPASGGGSGNQFRESVPATYDRVITPRDLRRHLDNFVIGQERAKKVLSVAVYNHYQRIREAQRREGEAHLNQDSLCSQGWQQEKDEDSDVDHGQAGQLQGSTSSQSLARLDPSPPRSKQAIIESLVDSAAPILEKSNVMLLGPSGVGKTLMAKTLAQVLAVPFSMSDCTPFTQAGYIGEDADVCVHRLLAAANYDVAAAERGIICLDEIDKISTAKVNHGKDVSGEGVQQALLKIIEGTTLQIQAKPSKSSSTRGEASSARHLAESPSSRDDRTASSIPGGVGSTPIASTLPPTVGSGSNLGQNKAETFTVRTDNILFICTGAFIGLHKMIMSRMAKGSIGFNSPLGHRSSASSSVASDKDTMISVIPNSEESKPFAKYLPMQYGNSKTDSSVAIDLNVLDMVEPLDLQTFGMIPELIGRIPVVAALSKLSESDLVRVLTEPRNSLMKQYEQLFKLSGIKLQCTNGALREIARSSLEMGTGARGLRTVLERLLTESMYEAPGSSIKYILVTEAVAKGTTAPIYFARGQQLRFDNLIAAEEETWSGENARQSEISNDETSTDQRQESETENEIDKHHASDSAAATNDGNFP